MTGTNLPAPPEMGGASLCARCRRTIPGAPLRFGVVEFIDTYVPARTRPDLPQTPRRVDIDGIDVEQVVPLDGEDYVLVQRDRLSSCECPNCGEVRSQAWTLFVADRRSK
jgi:hypothetical protein